MSCWICVQYRRLSLQLPFFFSLSSFNQCFWTDRWRVFAIFDELLLKACATSLVGHTGGKVCDTYSINLKFHMWEHCMPCALEKKIMVEVGGPVQSHGYPAKTWSHICRYLWNKCLSCALADLRFSLFIYQLWSIRKSKKYRNSETRLKVTQKKLVNKSMMQNVDWILGGLIRAGRLPADYKFVTSLPLAF